MAGILDPKTRIMDFIVTKTGRQEYRDGGLEFKFISFSDDGVFYSTDDGLTADDAGKRIAFEATSLPRDTIIPEFDAGASISVNIPAGNNLISNKMFQSGSRTPITGTQNLYSGSQEVMKSCHKHFEELCSLGTRNIFTINDNFSLGISPDSNQTTDNNIQRVEPGTYVTMKYPRGNLGFGTTTGIARIDYASHLLPLIADPRFSHIPNFEELCPYVYDYANEQLLPLGMYPAIAGVQEPQTMAQTIRKDILRSIISLGKMSDDAGVLNSIQGPFGTAGNVDVPNPDEYEYDPEGVLPLFQRSTDHDSTAYVEFTEVSDDNNLLMQVFSNTETDVEKLVLVDAGEFQNNDPSSPGTRFVHAGKIVKPKSGIPKFVRIFTFEFS
jgi:hypothetical protein